MALEACESTDKKALVLGSVGPLEQCYTPELAPDSNTCRKEHGKCIKRLMDEGCDYILIETMNNAREAVIAAEVAQKIAPGRWGISFSMPTETVGIQRCGTPVADIVDKLKDAAFIGVNCMDAKEMGKQVRHLRKIVPKNIRIMAYGNIGYWSP